VRNVFSPTVDTCEWGGPQVELAKLMIDKGASTTAKNLLKQSPMDLATVGANIFGLAKRVSVWTVLSVLMVVCSCFFFSFAVHLGVLHLSMVLCLTRNCNLYASVQGGARSLPHAPCRALPAARSLPRAPCRARASRTHTQKTDSDMGNITQH